jgi:predicted Na+-dependent transporter
MPGTREIVRNRLRASGSLVFAAAAAIAAVVLSARFAPAESDLVRTLAAILIVVVSVMFFRGFRARRAVERRTDERRELERRDADVPEA